MAFGDLPGGPVAKTLQQDKFYCAHASSEKSCLFIITSQSTSMEQLVTAHRVTDNWVILLPFECHGHQDYGNPWRMSVLIFYSLSWWCKVSLLGSLGRLGPWHNPGSCWTTLESMVVGGAFQSYHLSTLLILYRTEPNPEREWLFWKQVSSQWRDWNFF